MVFLTILLAFLHSVPNMTSQIAALLVSQDALHWRSSCGTFAFNLFFGFPPPFAIHLNYLLHPSLACIGYEIWISSPNYSVALGLCIGIDIPSQCCMDIRHLVTALGSTVLWLSHRPFLAVVPWLLETPNACVSTLPSAATANTKTNPKNSYIMRFFLSLHNDTNDTRVQQSHSFDDYQHCTGFRRSFCTSIKSSSRQMALLFLNVALTE